MTDYPEAAPVPETDPLPGFETKLRGVTFATEGTGLVRECMIRNENCAVGDLLIVRQEEYNRKDPNAVEALLQSGIQVGYIPASNNANLIVKKELDAGKKCGAFVTEIRGVTPTHPNHGISVFVFNVEEGTEDVEIENLFKERQEKLNKRRGEEETCAVLSGWTGTHSRESLTMQITMPIR